MITFEREGKCFNYRVVGVAVRDGMVLLHNTDKEYWSLPGGRGEFGEDSRLTIEREMKEELEIDIEVEQLIWVVENFFGYEGADWHEIAFYYLMRLPKDSPFMNEGGPFQGKEEHNDLIFRWFQIDSLGEIVLFPKFLVEGLANLPTETVHIIEREETESK